MSWHAPVPGVSDIFGSEARTLRRLQGDVLSLFAAHGYDEVIPPLLERPDVLLTGAGRFLMNNTLVFNDPEARGQLAVRSDMTPQIARIAATRLQREAQLKLCYSGPVVQARGDHFDGRRQQWQTGVECLGDRSERCDLDVLHLAALSMLAAGFADPVLQIGHVGIVQALCAGSQHGFADWVEVLQRRSADDVQLLLADDQLDKKRAQALLDIAGMQADQAWLQQHADAFGPDFAAAAKHLLQLAETAGELLGEDVTILVDAALMPHFLYHSGLMFRGYAPHTHSAVLCGGRYDEMMAAHGRAMPAIGFSFDLQRWVQHVAA